MRIQNWLVDKPVPARNPRVIPQSAIDKTAASIAEYGWRQPIVVDQKGVVIVGHVRLLAAQKLGHAKVQGLLRGQERGPPGVEEVSLEAEEPSRETKPAGSGTSTVQSWLFDKHPNGDPRREFPDQYARSSRTRQHHRAFPQPSIGVV